MYNKYNVSVKEERTVDGIVFDSKKEANRYKELKILERGKVIKDLKLQPNFPLLESFKYKGKLIRGVKYYADFSYYDNEVKKWIIEDVKGKKTDVYMLKVKLFKNIIKGNDDLIFRET